MFLVAKTVAGWISVVMNAHNEGYSKDEEYPAVDHVPHPVILLQVGGHPDFNHRGEYGHDHPLRVTDTEKIFDPVLRIGGTTAFWADTFLGNFSLFLLGGDAHDNEGGESIGFSYKVFCIQQRSRM